MKRENESDGLRKHVQPPNLSNLCQFEKIIQNQFSGTLFESLTLPWFLVHPLFPETSSSIFFFLGDQIQQMRKNWEIDLLCLI